MSSDITFDHTQQVHRCVAYFINLAAKEGQKVFGEGINFESAGLPSTLMDFFNLVSPPDVTQFDLKTI